MASSKSIAPHAPTIGSNATLGTSAVLLSLLSAPLYDGKHTVLSRTHTHLSVVQGPGQALLWARPLVPSGCAMNTSLRVRAAVDPIVSAKVVYVLGASSGKDNPGLLALAGQSGAALWAWAPPAGEGGESTDCPVAMAGSERADALYVASVGLDARDSRSPSHTADDNSSGGGGGGGGDLVGGGLSIWRLGLPGGAVAWRTRLCNASVACVPLSMVVLPEGGIAILTSNSTHLLLSAVDESGKSLWERIVSAHPQQALELAPGQFEYGRGKAGAPSRSIGSGTALLVVPAGAAAESDAGGGMGGGTENTDGAGTPGKGDNGGKGTSSGNSASGGETPGEGDGARSLRVGTGDAQSASAGGSFLLLLSPDAFSGWPNETLSSFHTSTGEALSSVRLDTLLTAPSAGCLPPVYHTPQALVALVCATLPSGAQLLQFSISAAGILHPVTAKGAPLGPDSAELLPQRLAIDAAGTVLALMRANGTLGRIHRPPLASPLPHSSPPHAQAALRVGDKPTASSKGTLLCSLRLLPLQNRMSGGARGGPAVRLPPTAEPAFPPLELPAGLLPSRVDPWAVAGVVLAADGMLVAGGGSLLVSVTETDACTASRCHPIHGRCEVGEDGTPRCFCESNWLGTPDSWEPFFCGREYAPGDYSIPLWISFGVGAAMLALFAGMMCCLYRSLLWLRFRVKLAPIYDSLLYRNSLAGQDAAATMAAAGSRCGSEAPPCIHVPSPRYFDLPCTVSSLPPLYLKISPYVPCALTRQQGSRHRPTAACARDGSLPFFVSP
jgi:hypothetical protein